MNRTTWPAGFTLLELMVTVVIVAILASIALPSYQSQIRKTRRADAKIGLVQTAQALERCFTQFDAYNSTSCSGIVSAGPTVSLTSPDGHYTILSKDASNTERLTASGFTLYATPVATDPQTQDTPCPSFSLSNIGLKAPTSGCW